MCDENKKASEFVDNYHELLGKYNTMIDDSEDRQIATGSPILVYYSHLIGTYAANWCLHTSQYLNYEYYVIHVSISDKESPRIEILNVKDMDSIKFDALSELLNKNETVVCNAKPEITPTVWSKIKTKIKKIFNSFKKNTNG